MTKEYSTSKINIGFRFNPLDVFNELKLINQDKHVLVTNDEQDIDNTIIKLMRK